MPRPLSPAPLLLLATLHLACGGAPVTHQVFSRQQSPLVKALVAAEITPRPGQLVFAEDGTPLLAIDSDAGQLLLMVEPKTPAEASCGNLRPTETMQWWFFEQEDPLALSLTDREARFWRWNPALGCLATWHAFSLIATDGEPLLELSLVYEVDQDRPPQELIKAHDILPWPGTERLRFSFERLEIKDQDGKLLLEQPILVEAPCSYAKAQFSRPDPDHVLLRIETVDGNTCVSDEAIEKTTRIVELVWSDLDDAFFLQSEQDTYEALVRTWSSTESFYRTHLTQRMAIPFGFVDHIAQRELYAADVRNETSLEEPCVSPSGNPDVKVEVCTRLQNHSARTSRWTFSDGEHRVWDLAQMAWSTPTTEKESCEIVCGY